MIQYIDFMNLFYVYFVYIYIVDLPLIIPSNLFSTIQISVIYSSDSKHQWNQHILSTFILRYCFLSVVLVSAINYTMFLLLLSFFKLITAVFPFIYLFFFLLSILYSTCSIIFQAVPEICSRGIYAIIKLLNNFVFLLISSYKIESNLIAVGFCDYACSVLFLVQIFKFYENNQICKLYGIFENLEKIYLLRFFVCATVVLSLLPPLSFAHYSYQTWLIASLCSCAVIHICYSM